MEEVMKDEIVKVKVAFKYSSGEVLAHIKAWYNKETRKWVKCGDGCTAEAYAHVGQHFEVSRYHISNARSARPSEYAALKNEMEDLVGYEIVDVTRGRDSAA